MATSIACGISWARDWIGAAAVTYTMAVARQVLNLLHWAGEQTCTIIETTLDP